MHATTWDVKVYFSEDGDQTQARAVLAGADGQVRVQGAGVARKNPTDADVPEIGDELAAARALSALAHQLLDLAAGDIEAIRHEAAHLLM